MQRWETDTRYYAARLHKDLFGTWCVTRAWGGLRSNGGGIKTEPVSNWAAGIARLRAIGERRRARHYRAAKVPV